MTVKLEVQKREQPADVVRADGKVPGIVYGPKQEAINISVDAGIFKKTLHEAGESTIISLEGLGDVIEVLVHDVAFNPAKGGIEHVDFYAIERGKELTTHVALEFVGVAPVEKTGASVTKALHELEITCRPADLPAHLTVDVSTLVDEDSQIKVSDLVVPKGVKIEAEPELVLVTVSGAREEEPEETAAIDMDAIAVEEKGKKEEKEEAE